MAGSAAGNYVDDIAAAARPPLPPLDPIRQRSFTDTARSIAGCTPSEDRHRRPLTEIRTSDNHLIQSGVSTSHPGKGEGHRAAKAKSSKLSDLEAGEARRIAGGENQKLAVSAQTKSDQSVTVEGKDGGAPELRCADEKEAMHTKAELEVGTRYSGDGVARDGDHIANQRIHITSPVDHDNALSYGDIPMEKESSSIKGRHGGIGVYSYVHVGKEMTGSASRLEKVGNTRSESVNGNLSATGNSIEGEVASGIRGETSVTSGTRGREEEEAGNAGSPARKKARGGTGATIRQGETGTLAQTPNCAISHHTVAKSDDRTRQLGQLASRDLQPAIGSTSSQIVHTSPSVFSSLGHTPKHANIATSSVSNHLDRVDASKLEKLSSGTDSTRSECKPLPVSKWRPIGQAQLKVSGPLRDAELAPTTPLPTASSRPSIPSPAEPGNGARRGEIPELKRNTSHVGPSIQTHQSSPAYLPPQEVSRAQQHSSTSKSSDRNRPVDRNSSNRSRASDMRSGSSLPHRSNSSTHARTWKRDSMGWSAYGTVDTNVSAHRSAGKVDWDRPKESSAGVAEGYEVSTAGMARRRLQPMGWSSLNAVPMMDEARGSWMRLDPLSFWREGGEGRVTEPAFVQKASPWEFRGDLRLDKKMLVVHHYIIKLHRIPGETGTVIGEAFGSRSLPTFVLDSPESYMVGRHNLQISITYDASCPIARHAKRIRQCTDLQDATWRKIDREASGHLGFVIGLHQRARFNIGCDPDVLLRCLLSTLEELLLASEAALHRLISPLAISRPNLLGVFCSSSNAARSHVAYLSHLGDALAGFTLASLVLDRIWNHLATIEGPPGSDIATEAIESYSGHVTRLETNLAMRQGWEAAGLTKFSRRAEWSLTTLPAVFEPMMTLPSHPTPHADPLKWISGHLEEVVGAVHEGPAGARIEFPEVDHGPIRRFIGTFYPADFPDGSDFIFDGAESAASLGPESCREIRQREAFLNLMDFGKLQDYEIVVLRLGFMSEEDSFRSNVLRLLWTAGPNLGRAALKDLKTRREYAPPGSDSRHTTKVPQNVHDVTTAFLKDTCVAKIVRVSGLADIWGVMFDGDFAICETFYRVLSVLSKLCERKPARMGPVLLAMERWHLLATKARHEDENRWGSAKRTAVPDNM